MIKILPPRQSFRTRTILFVLFVLVAVVYGNALDRGSLSGMTNFLVRGNAYIRDLRAVPLIFTSAIGSGAGVIYDSYRPVQLPFVSAGLSDLGIESCRLSSD